MMDKMNRTIRQTRTCNRTFETREEKGERRIEGYFAVFDSGYELWPGAVETISPNAFDGALTDDIRCLVDHDTRLVLGRTTAGTLTLRVDDHGLWGSVLINPDDGDAMNLYARVQRGDVSQCSFKFEILEESTEWLENGDIHWTILKVKLYEVSCVTFPAYKDTEISARKADYESMRRDRVEAWKDQMKARLNKWH